MSVQMRLTDDERAQLRSMGFTHGVMIVKDVSVVVPGAVESVFQRKNDAVAERTRLNHMFAGIALDSHRVVEI